MKNNNVGAGLDQPAEKNKGITLIALIITIIVMLILVVVSIQIALNTGLFDAAGKATQKTNIAKEQEKELASGKVNIDGTTYNSIDEYISGMGDIKPGQRANDDNETYKGVTIPKGFTVSKIDGEYEDVSKGLVIYDIPAEDLKDKTKVDWDNPDTVKTNYNQFVWIPVEVNKTTAPVDTETSIASFRRSYWADSTDGGTRSQDIPNDGTDYYTEPYAYDDTNDYDGADGTGIKAQIEELTKSIYKYEGFYIARYEAGVEGTTARTSSSSQTASFVVRQDKYPYNYIKWGTDMDTVNTEGAVYLSNNLYPSTNTNYGAASMLCTGACWDAVLDFVKDSSHNVTSSGSWGNYYDSETYKVYRGSLFQNSAWSLADTTNGTEVTKNKSILLTTGATERNSSKNIYDIAGNCYEWTTEADNTDYRVLRGGCCSSVGSSNPASHRTCNYPDVGSNVSNSFRPTLYIK